MRKLLFAMAMGAALAWLFDPDAGSRRRDMIRRKFDERGLTGPSPTTTSPVADHPFAATGAMRKQA